MSTNNTNFRLIAQKLGSGRVFLFCKNSSYFWYFSKLFWNTETNRNKIIIGFENEQKKTRNRSCFGYFRFKPKFLFICFVDTLCRIHCRVAIRRCMIHHGVCVSILNLNININIQYEFHYVRKRDCSDFYIFFIKL